MNREIQLLDVAALTVDKPEHGLVRGQVGTVVELLAPGVFEVEFAGQDGKPYAFAALRAPELIALHYEPLRAAG
jgi:hypothetical protein